MRWAGLSYTCSGVKVVYFSSRGSISLLVKRETSMDLLDPHVLVASPAAAHGSVNLIYGVIC